MWKPVFIKSHTWWGGIRSNEHPSVCTPEHAPFGMVMSLCTDKYPVLDILSWSWQLHLLGFLVRAVIENFCFLSHVLDHVYEILGFFMLGNITAFMEVWTCGGPKALVVLRIHDIHIYMIYRTYLLPFKLNITSKVILMSENTFLAISQNLSLMKSD